jgi:Primase C terminal 1 (PriCT-1)
MRHANHVDGFDTLLDVARTFNDNCEPPMGDSEVMSVAQSAWANYRTRR